MKIKFWIDILSLGVPALYIFVALIINAAERSSYNSLPSEIDVSLFADSASAALSNIVSDPVVNLRVVNASDGCNSSAIPTLFKWETVMKYCQCQFSVLRTYCSRYSGCKNHSRVTIPFNRWKGMQFCLDTLKKEDWKLSLGGSSPCPEGFKLCKGRVCVRKTILDCPITDVIVSQSQPSSPEGNYKLVSQFVNGASVYISRDLEKTPLVTMTAGIPSTPCINTRVYPTRTKGNSYPIIQIQPVGCEAGGDYGVDKSSHVALDTGSEWSFHDENHYAYFNDLPGYRDYVGNEQVTLFARKKIEFKSDKDVCLSFDYQSLKDVANDLSILEAMRLISNICDFIIFSIAVLVLLILGLLRCLCKKGDQSRLIITTNIFAIINAVLLIILCVIGYSYISAIDSNSTLMNEIADNKCFKIEGYNKLFSSLQNYMLASFSSQKSYNTANLVLAVLCLVMQFVLLIISCVIRFSKRDYDTNL